MNIMYSSIIILQLCRCVNVIVFVLDITSYKEELFTECKEISPLWLYIICYIIIHSLAIQSVSYVSTAYRFSFRFHFDMMMLLFFRRQTGIMSSVYFFSYLTVFFFNGIVYAFKLNIYC